MPTYYYDYVEVQMEGDEYIEVQLVSSGTTAAVRLWGNGDIHFTSALESTDTIG